MEEKRREDASVPIPLVCLRFLSNPLKKQIREQTSSLLSASTLNPLALSDLGLFSLSQHEPVYSHF